MKCKVCGNDYVEEEMCTICTIYNVPEIPLGNVKKVDIAKMNGVQEAPQFIPENVDGNLKIIVE